MKKDGIESPKNERPRSVQLSWDQLIYEIYVRQSIEAGLADSKAGKTLDVSDVRKRFGLPM